MGQPQDRWRLGAHLSLELVSPAVTGPQAFWPEHPDR